MSKTMNYQPWLQAILAIAKHYRIEPSEERLRLQLEWNPNQSIDDIDVLLEEEEVKTIFDSIKIEKK